jgi:threonine aldolase
MRQAGILAAAGVVALEQMVERLGEDHKRAKDLGKGLFIIPEIKFDLKTQHTNMVFFELSKDVRLTPREFVAAVKDKGLLVEGLGASRFRMVTHYWVDDSAVKNALEIIETVVSRQ